VGVRDNKGLTPLHISVLAEDSNMTEFLIECGANPKASSDLEGPGPIHFAAFGASIPNVEVLLSAGADINRLTDDGRTPLDLSQARHKSVAPDAQDKCAQFLRSRGAKTGVELKQQQALSQNKKTSGEKARPRNNKKREAEVLKARAAAKEKAREEE